MIGNDDKSFLYITLPYFVVLSTYWVTTLLFMILDFTQRPRFLCKYKTQPGMNEPPNLKNVMKVN